MPSLPTGTVTFLFTDIEGSTALLQHLGDQYAQVLTQYRSLLRSAFQSRGGQEVDTQGDAFFFAFSRARDAVAAAVAAQHGILRQSWPEAVSVRVRMGIHTGDAFVEARGYVGMDVHRAARICAAGHGGQILLSDATRTLIEKDLPSGVNLSDLGQHRLKDLATPEHLFQVVAADLSIDFPPLNSLDTLPRNLPRYLTSFVGREREIAEVKRLLSGTSLLTLTGTGGSGKTRLAAKVATDLLDQYPDGVWWVEFAHLADAELVLQAVSSALSVREQPGRPPIQALLAYLRFRTSLLVLDNCEHLLSACAQLAHSLLDSCPHLRILATSREGLNIAGEVLYRVASLSLPDAQRLPPIEKVKQYEAVRLFSERALAVLPIFRVTESNARAVVEICDRLDGIPLAIELAAVRVKVLPVEKIANRLNDQFRLLTTGSRMSVPRHQTLRATLDWSYDLLSQKERLVFQWLSVFAGGWTLEAAEAVCAGEAFDRSEILDLLTHLIDKSLVVVDGYEGRGRYQMLESVRQYGRDRLQKSAEAGVVFKRHGDFFLTLAEEAEPHVWSSSRQEEWLNRLEMDHDNLRAALEWSSGEEGGAEEHWRLVGALMRFWVVRGYFSEGRKWVEEARVRQNRTSVSIQAKVLAEAGYLAWYQGDYARTTALSEEGLGLARQVGDKRLIARAINILGLVAREQGEFAKAAALYQESLDLLREVGDKRGIAIGLHNLGRVALYKGDFHRATTLHEESLRILRELGNTWGIAIVLLNLGAAAARQGDYDKAAALHKQSLHLFRALGDRAQIPETFEELAGVATASQEPERAARLLGAAELLREEIATPLSPAERVDYERTVAATRAILDEGTFTTSWAEGRAMPLELAIEYALK